MFSRFRQAVLLFLPVIAALVGILADAKFKPLLAAVGIFFLILGLVVLSRERRSGTSVPVKRSRTPVDLPPQVGPLLGRDDKLAEVVRLCTSPGGDTARIVVIRGEAGMGKTALAVHAAHRMAKDFPDGRLSISLEQNLYGDKYVRHILGDFLQALDGIGAREVDDETTLAARYHRVTRDRAVLIVLDAVENIPPENVQALLPRGPRCAAIVTSRKDFDIGQGSTVTLRPLEPEYSVQLLGNLIGSKRVQGDQESAATRIAELCAYHPYSLEFAASSLVDRPRSALNIAVLRASEFWTAHRPPSPPPAGEPAKSAELRYALDFGFALLTEEERNAVRRLGLIEPHFYPWMLQALLKVDEPEAMRIVNRLVAVQLVERITADSAGVPVYRTHDWVRQYARDVLDRGTPTAERRNEKDEITRAANRHLSSSMPAATIQDTVYGDIDKGELASAFQKARQSLAVARKKEEKTPEGLALMALAELRAEAGETDVVRDLAEMAWNIDVPEVRARVCRVQGHLYRRVRRLRDAEQALRLGLELLGGADDSEGIRIRAELVLVYALDSRLREGLELSVAVLRECEAKGPAGKGLLPRVLLAKGMVHAGLGDFEAAESEMCRAAEVAEGLKFALWQAWIQYRRAETAVTAGRVREAQGTLYTALEQFTAIGHRYGVGHCRSLLARIHVMTGQLLHAEAAAEEAVETFRTCGDAWIDADAALVLADIQRRSRRPGDAQATLRTAARLLGQVGDGWRAARVRGAALLLYLPRARSVLLGALPSRRSAESSGHA
ncbi:NB-ARC domain-containing protein [Actinoplanes utahensis]|uniref:NB-ARC domain-containing protein n=1 Tax=Actinoplanes utahensis TaxID=1869 RepID=A0A0A6UPY3_ACTUT|nr:NB-ARC domain-containing protein [Actinoplanes utahensis]KHD78195.1 hypothetical protein MB27_07060 [Actinoplanes utahensis]